MNEGWTCPKCGSVMSPLMPTCVRDHASEFVVSTSSVPIMPAQGTGDSNTLGRCVTCGGPFALCHGSHTVA